MDYTLHSIDAAAEHIISAMSSKILLLYGEMGTGKTTMVKSLVKALGSSDDVSSPTFSIVNEYEIENDVIYHFDLYRIKDLDEAFNFGIEEYLYSNHWVFIEWPEKIESMLPEVFDRLDLQTNSDGSRSIKLNFKSNFIKQIC